MDTLTSVRIAGEWHAIYPRARRTLCLIVGEQAMRAIGRRYAPTCRSCVRASRVMERLTRGSIPRHWS